MNYPEASLPFPATSTGSSVLGAEINIILIPALVTDVRAVSVTRSNQICAYNQRQCVDLQTDVPSYPIS